MDISSHNFVVKIVVLARKNPKVNAEKRPGMALFKKTNNKYHIYFCSLNLPKFIDNDRVFRNRLETQKTTKTLFSFVN